MRQTATETFGDRLQMVHRGMTCLLLFIQYPSPNLRNPLNSECIVRNLLVKTATPQTRPMIITVVYTTPTTAPYS